MLCEVSGDEGKRNGDVKRGQKNGAHGQQGIQGGRKRRVRTTKKKQERELHGEMPRKAVRKENTKGCGRERGKAG